jgi:uncharacterized CHY-type Zn-finger protein
MGAMKMPKRKLKFSGVPVICKDCSTELFKEDYKKCSICGAYLCPSCEDTHKKRH